MRGLILFLPVWLLAGSVALAQLPPPGAVAPPPGMPSAAMPGNAPVLSEPMSQGAANVDTQDQPYPQAAPALPAPPIGNNARPEDYLQMAAAALQAGDTGEAQQSLEMAQTRLLDRSVPYGETDRPSRNPAVDRISQALQALAAGDQARCMQLIQMAMADAQRTAPPAAR